MKRNLVPLLGIALVVAIASTGIFYGLFVNKIRSSSGAKKAMVVAAHEIKRGAVLTSDDLATAPWSGDALPNGTFSDVASAVGATVVEAIGDGEPVLRERLVSKDGTQNGLTIPSGLRAVSVHVTDSSGVLSLIRPGYKVDVQVVSPRGGNPSEAEVRTVIENVSVVQVGSPEPASQGFSAPVLTVLAKPSDADILAVADAAARVRVALRNPLDPETRRASGLTLASVFRGRTSGTTMPNLPVVAANPTVKRAVASVQPHPAPAAAQRTDQTVSLWVRVAAIDRGGLDEINPQLISPTHSDLLQVSAFRPGSDPEASIRRLEDKHLMQTVSTTRLTAGLNRAVSVQAGAHPVSEETGKIASGDPDCGIRIRFSPFLTESGKLRLRVSPEITAPRGDMMWVRKAETEAELTDGQSFLVTGLLAERDEAAVLGRLFASPSRAAGEELMVMVTVQFPGPVRTANLRP